MLKPARPLLAATLLLALAMAAGVRADEDGDDDGASQLDAVRAAVERGEIQSLGALKAILRQRFPGDIVHVATERKNGRFAYEFRVLRADGNLVEIEMDAASGRILEVENE